MCYRVFIISVVIFSKKNNSLIKISVLYFNYLRETEFTLIKQK